MICKKADFNLSARLNWNYTLLKMKWCYRCSKLDYIFLRWNMTTCFLTNHYFPKTSSVVQKCRLHRLISEHTRKTKSDMALLASRKMENISPKGMLYMKTLANNSLKSFQLKQHLNNAHKEQPSKIDWAGYFTVSLRKVVSNMSDWM